MHADLPGGGAESRWPPGRRRSRSLIVLAVAVGTAVILAGVLPLRGRSAAMETTPMATTPMETSAVEQHYRSFPGVRMPLPAERTLPGEALWDLDSGARGSDGDVTYRMGFVSGLSAGSDILLCAEPASAPPGFCQFKRSPDRTAVVDGVRVMIYVQNGDDRVRARWREVPLTLDYTQSPLVRRGKRK